MDDALLVRVLDRMANLNKQAKPLTGGKTVPVTVVGDANALDQFHGKEGSARLGSAGIEHFGDVRMVHEGEPLTLGFEASDHLPCVHAQFDDLEGDAPADRLGLLGHVNDAAAALADLLQEFVPPDMVSGFLAHHDLSLGLRARQLQRAPGRAHGASALRDTVGQRRSAFSA